MPTTKPPSSDVAIFKADGSFALEVRVETDTVWLTQKQLAVLFGTTAPNITMHLANIYRERELVRSRTTKDFLAVQLEGIRKVRRTIPHYNLDAILSVGYRINSKRGTQFRIWANSVLRDHLLKGYTLNASRLEARGVAELQSAIDLLSSTLLAQGLVSDEGRALLEIIQTYARSWQLLLAYDEGSLTQPPTAAKRPANLSPAKARKAISALKRDLLTAGSATDLFGLECEPACNFDPSDGVIGAQF